MLKKIALVFYLDEYMIVPVQITLTIFVHNLYCTYLYVNIKNKNVVYSQ